MLRFLRKFRKSFKTACLTAALATCWQVGQPAKADWGDWNEVTFRLTGTVTPTQHNVSNLYLLYGLNNSYVREFSYISLGNFPAGVISNLSIDMTVPYDESIFDSDDKNVYWEAVGLYGDISGGYDDKKNGVTLGINAAVGDPWSSHTWRDEGEVFSRLIDNQDSHQWDSGFHPWYPIDFQYHSFNLTINLFDFSNASYNGQVQLNLEVVPEPVTIILFGTGGLIVAAFRRRR